MPEGKGRPDEAAVEGSDIDPRSVLAVGALILLVLALAAVAIWGLLRLLAMPAGPYATADFRAEAPRLQSAPQDEKAAYLAEKDGRLNSYGWVDRQAGTAHIPIEAAMDLLAARRGGPAPGPGGGP